MDLQELLIASLGVIVVLCTWLLLKRVGFFTGMLLKQAIDNVEERKLSNALINQQLADERESARISLDKKVDEAINIVKLVFQNEVLLVRARLHKLEGSTANKEQEILEMIEKYDHGEIKLKGKEDSEITGDSSDLEDLADAMKEQSLEQQDRSNIIIVEK